MLLPACQIQKSKAVAIVAIILFTLLIPASLHSQEATGAFDPRTWQPPYSLPVPDGWNTERFPIPIGFAPQIPYKGVEDIRFAPGWGKAGSENYWSYAFLWFLDGKIEMDTATVRRNIIAYYTGLIAVNGSAIPADQLVPVKASFDEMARSGSDIQTFSGVISMTDYMKKSPIELRCRIHVRSCDGLDKTLIFYELSPRPFTDSIWIELDGLWNRFACR